MRIGLLGTGMVGYAVGSKLIELGHEVKMGSRSATNPRAVAWAARHGAQASAGHFSDAAEFGEIIFNATTGAASLEVLRSAGSQNLEGKILIDQSNPHVFGRAVSFAVCNTDSLAEQIQREFPKTRVVKALNNLNNSIMIEPGKLPAETDVFLCGNDIGAKRKVVELLRALGWTRITDLGDLTGARALEMYTMFFIRLFQTYGSPVFNIQIVRNKLPIKSVDLYREVHKGLRHALFEVTALAGRTDGEDRSAVATLVGEVDKLVWILREHARHEDSQVQPYVAEYLPEIAQTVERSHAESNAGLDALERTAKTLSAEPGSALVQRLYLDLASFTGTYLLHLNDEETTVMPALQNALSLDELIAIQNRLRGAVAPEDMSKFMRNMLPAMSIDERTMMLGGMKQFAPPAIFEMFRKLAESVLEAGDYRAVARRIGLEA